MKVPSDLGVEGNEAIGLFMMEIKKFLRLTWELETLLLILSYVDGFRTDRQT